MDAHRRHRVLDGAVRGHHDDIALRRHRLDRFQQRQAVHARHDEVGQDEVDRLALQDPQGLFAFAGDPGALRDRGGLVLTPHAGELAALLGQDAAEEIDLVVVPGHLEQVQTAPDRPHARIPGTEHHALHARVQHRPRRRFLPERTVGVPELVALLVDRPLVVGVEDAPVVVEIRDHCCPANC